MWGLEAGLHRLSSSRPSVVREQRHCQSTSWPAGLLQGCPRQSSSCPRTVSDNIHSRSLHATNYAGEQVPAAYSSTSLARSYLQDGQEPQQVQEHAVQHLSSLRSPYQQQQPRQQLLTQSDGLNNSSSWGATAGRNGHSIASPLELEQQQHPGPLDGPQQPCNHIAGDSSSSSGRHNGRQRGQQQQQQDAPQQQPRRKQQSRQQQQQQGSRNPKRPGRHTSAGRSSSQDQLASRQLTAAISGSSSWQQLHHLLLQDSNNMNHIHACALLSTTSKVVQYSELDPQEQQQFADYYVAALQLAFAKTQTTAGPREVSSMLWAVARVGLHPGPDWLAAYLQAAAVHIPQMNPQDVGLIIWALARFRHVPEPQWQQQLLSVTLQKMQGFDAQGLCNLLWGVATLDLRPSRRWLAAAVAAAEQVMPRFQPQGLANVLWAVAKLKHQPQQQWLQAAADAAAAKLHSFKPAELAMLCHSLAKLHYKPSSSSSTSSEGSSQSTGDHGDQQQQQQQHFLQRVQDASVHSLQRLRFAEAANMVWALGVMEQQPQQQWLAAALRQLQITMQHADGKALANACYGLARMQQRPDQQFWDVVWQQIPRVVGRSLPLLLQQQQYNGAGDCPAPAAAAAVDESVARSSSESPAAAAVAAAGDAAAGTADSQAVATLLLSLAKLGFVRGIPHHVALVLLDASQQYLQQQAMNGAEVSAVAMAAAKCKLQPQQQWFEALEQSFLLLVQQSLGQQQQQQWHSRQRHRQQLASPQDPYSSSSSGHTSTDVQQQGPITDHQQQQQQQRRYVQELHLIMKPKEVCNTLISIARLRYLPSTELLEAVQQYRQQYSKLFNQVDQQQLRKALQSLSDQQTAVQQQVAITAVLQGTAAPAIQQCGTALEHGSSSSNGRHGQQFSSGNEHGSLHGDQHTCDVVAAEADSDVAELEPDAVEACGIGSSNSSSNSSSDQSHRLQPYGRYVLRFAGAQGPPLWHEAATVDVAGSHHGGSSSSRGRSEALASAVQQVMLVGRGLSVAAG